MTTGISIRKKRDYHDIVLESIPTRSETPLHYLPVVNGSVIPIWSALQPLGWTPEQVYVTTVLPRSSKGPHLHKIRHGRFVCLYGRVTLIRRDAEKRYLTTVLDADWPLIADIPPGTAVELINPSESITAIVLNLPTPAWDPENPDEHEVNDWRPSYEVP